MTYPFIIRPMVPLWRPDNTSPWIEGDPPEDVERYQRLFVPPYSFPPPQVREVKPNGT